MKEDVVAGKYRLVYILPESCLGVVSRFQDMLLTLLYQEPLVGTVFNEAHWVSQQ